MRGHGHGPYQSNQFMDQMKIWSKHWTDWTEVRHDPTTPKSEALLPFSGVRPSAGAMGPPSAPAQGLRTLSEGTHP